MLIILQILILLLPLAAEAYLDYRGYKKGLKLNHTKNVLLVRIPLIAGASLLNAVIMNNGFSYPVNVIQSGLLSAGLFVLLYDYIIGYLETKNPFFEGTTAKEDRWFSMMGPIQAAIWKILIFLWPFGIYVGLDKVIN